MTLRQKTLAIVTLTLICSVIILYTLSRIILLGSFADLEKQHTHQNIQRALSALADEFSVLDAMAFNCAARDDTYEFIEDSNEAYIQSYLADQTFITSRLNLVVYFDSSGQVIFAKGFDLFKKEAMPIPRDFYEHIANNPSLLHHYDPMSYKKGVLLLPSGPLLVASRPILTSEQEGPIRGTLIMGRYLNSTVVNHLAETTHLSLATYQINDPQKPPDVAMARAFLSKEQPIFIRPLSSHTIAGYAMVEDVYGQPSLVLKVDMPREIYRQGQISLLYFALSLMAVGFVLNVVTMWLLEKSVLSRLFNLGKNVSGIRDSGDLSTRVQVTGNDELTHLGQTINGMLATLEQSHHQLQASEIRYRTLFENANDAIFIMREDRFIDCNPKTLEMFGCGKEQLVGQPPYHFSPELQPDGRNSKEKALEKIELALQGEPQFFEWRHIRHDATPFEAEVSLNRLELSGEIFLQAIVREVTQRKQAEQALIKASRMDTATTLAGGIAHKVNNLMVSVLGYAELLKAKLAQQSDASNMLTVIAESAQETGELAQQMLAFARSGQYQLQTINLNVILQKVLQLRPRSVWSKIQLEQNTSPDLWDVEADSTQISQVILNLLTNAREAIENNGRIIITTENIRVDETSKQQYPDLKRGPYVCLSVQDNGEGMSTETLAKVFEPFFTTKFQGRGMGLAAVYGIVHSHGGHITATSQPEAGTTFKVYLPAIQPELTQPPQSTSKEEIPPASAVEKKQTILVVEDEAMVLEMMQRMLNQLGYHPLMAQNEREAVEIAQTFQGDIHLMLLDIGIPAMSSMEMYSILTKIRPEMQVILCSSYELDDVARSLLEAGASGFMRKPFQMKVLEAEIHKVLAG